MDRASRVNKFRDSVPVSDQDGETALGRLAALTGEHEPSYPIANPETLLDRSISDPAVPRHDDKTKTTDNLEPLVVVGATRHFREIRVPGMHDAAIAEVKGSRQPYVRLVGEEPGTHRAALA